MFERALIMATKATGLIMYGLLIPARMIGAIPAVIGVFAYVGMVA